MGAEAPDHRGRLFFIALATMGLMLAGLGIGIWSVEYAGGACLSRAPAWCSPFSLTIEGPFEWIGLALVGIGGYISISSARSVFRLGQAVG